MFEMRSVLLALPGPWIRRNLLSCGLCVVFVAALETLARAEDSLIAKPTVQLINVDAVDQDDMCVWIHPQTPALSLIITSDKSGNHVFVYDLEGKLLQQLPAKKPGNIDLRQGVKLDGRSVDLVVVNQRTDGFKLIVYEVQSESRRLERIDKEALKTGPNYGGCLYHSARTGRLFFICTSDKGTVEQHELSGDGRGGIHGTRVRSWPVGKCEGAVADDRTGTLYIAEERAGIWEFAAEPDATPNGKLIIRVGEHGLTGDVEGLALYRRGPDQDYLIVSDQGRNRFAVYDRRVPYEFVGEFSIEGAQQTDGIELTAANLGTNFPKGCFACHTDRAPRAVQITPWERIFDRLTLKD